MKTLFLLLITCCAVAAQENRLQYIEDVSQSPKRIVGNKVYNAALATNLWKVVTMRYVRPQIYGGGWVVVGKIDETNTVFVLRNPPADVYQRFLTLKDQYFQVKPSYDAALQACKGSSNDLDSVKLHLAELTTQPMPRVGSRQEAIFLKDLDNTRGKQATLESQVLIQKAKVDQLKTKLDDLEASGFDFNGEFVFSCAVVKLTEVVNKMPVYDRGRIPGAIPF